MPFLRVPDLRRGAAQEFDGPEVRIGRDPECEFAIESFPLLPRKEPAEPGLH